MVDDSEPAPGGKMNEPPRARSAAMSATKRCRAESSDASSSPAGASSGAQPVVVTVSGQASQSGVTCNVQ